MHTIHTNKFDQSIITSNNSEHRWSSTRSDKCLICSTDHRWLNSVRNGWSSENCGPWLAMISAKYMPISREFIIISDLKQVDESSNIIVIGDYLNQRCSALIQFWTIATSSLISLLNSDGSNLATKASGGILLLISCTIPVSLGTSSRFIINDSKNRNLLSKLLTLNHTNCLGNIVVLTE